MNCSYTGKGKDRNEGTQGERRGKPCCLFCCYCCYFSCCYYCYCYCYCYCCYCYCCLVLLLLSLLLLLLLLVSIVKQDWLSPVYSGRLEYIAVHFCTWLCNSFRSSFEYTLRSTWRMNRPTQAKNAQYNLLWAYHSRRMRWHIHVC